MGKSKPASPKHLEPLRGVGRDVLTYILNRLAFEDFRSCCQTVKIAEALGKNPKRFQTTLARLADAGWLSIDPKGHVYPTVQAIQWQDPSLSESAARKLLRRARGG